MEHYEFYGEKVRAGILGHALGDALGVPVEFADRADLKVHPIDGMVGYGTHYVPPGTWSDDTSMELALMQSLIDKQKFDPVDIMQNFCRWLYQNEFTAIGRTFDVGITCSNAIDAFRNNGDPFKSGRQDRYSNGNGSLMRMLPIALLCYRHDIVGWERRNLVRHASALTHANEISVLGCYIYTNLVCHLLENISPHLALMDTLADDYSAFSDEALATYRRILLDDISVLTEAEIRSGGYVVDTLEAAIWCLLKTDSYRSAVLRAVNLGGDTDTTGAVTGSLAGLVYGYAALPSEWLGKLQRMSYIKKMCDEFANVDFVL